MTPEQPSQQPASGSDSPGKPDPRSGPGQAPPPPHQPQGTPPGAPYGGHVPPHTLAGPPLRPDEERLWGLLSHLSFFVLGVVGPLVVMMTLGKRSDSVRRQATEALNFQICVLIAVAVSVPLMLVLVGFLTFLAAIGAGAVFSVLAALQAHNGVEYRYPFTYRFVGSH